jgi:hypothetical protein
LNLEDYLRDHNTRFLTDEKKFAILASLARPTGEILEGARGTGARPSLKAEDDGGRETISKYDAFTVAEEELKRLGITDDEIGGKFRNWRVVRDGRNYTVSDAVRNEWEVTLNLQESRQS